MSNCIRAFSDHKQVETVEVSVQPDYVHVIAMIPPKLSISDFCGIGKGRTAIRVFNKFRDLKKKPSWGNHFWTEGSCVDTVGLDAEMIRKYVHYQEKRERRAEQQPRLF